jgi:quercetin dioxygenase-like cupin family protein
MPFYTRDNMRQPEQTGGIFRYFASGAKLSIMRCEMTPGSVVPIHDHPHEQVGVVLEGEFDFIIGAERRRVKAGDMYIIPGGTLHSAIALDQKVVFVDAWTPPREALPGEDALPRKP